MTTPDAITESIARLDGPVVLRAELLGRGTRAQVDRSLAILVAQGALARAGAGVYVKTRISSITGQRIPAAMLETVVAEAFRKLGIEASPGQATLAYNTGQSTQLPMQLVLNTGARRISRKLTVGGRTLGYERGRRL